MGIGSWYRGEHRVGIHRPLDMAWEFLQCLWVGEQEGAVSVDCFMVWQQGMHEEMGVMLREVEAG